MPYSRRRDHRSLAGHASARPGVDIHSVGGDSASDLSVVDDMERGGGSAGRMGGGRAAAAAAGGGARGGFTKAFGSQSHRSLPRVIHKRSARSCNVPPHLRPAAMIVDGVAAACARAGGSADARPKLGLKF